MQKPDFEALFDASPYPYLLMAVPDLTIIGANRAYLRATGSTAERIVGRYVFDAFPANPGDPDSTNLDLVKDSIARAIASGLPDSTPFLRYAVPRPDGSFNERFWSTVHTPVFDREGHVSFVSQNAIDITDLYTFNRSSQIPALTERPLSGAEASSFNQAQMHEALTRILNDERSHLRTLFDQAPGFIAVMKGRNHVFEIVNESFYQLVGRRDLIGRPAWEALPEATGQGYEELLNQVYESGKPFVGRGLRLRVQREPGEPRAERYIDLLYHPILGVDGRVTGIFAQGIDVTETWIAQALLAEQIGKLEKARAQQAFQLRLADVLRSPPNPEAVFRKSSELIGRHLGVSRVLFGEYDREKKQVFFHSNHTDGLVREVNGRYPAAVFGEANFTFLESGRIWISEDMEHDPRTSQPAIWSTFEALSVHASVVVPLSRQGTVTACLFITDSRPRPWSDEEIALIRDVAERVWNAIERIRAEEALRAADRRKDQFLAMLAHELRNPIAPISAAADLLQMAPHDADRVLRTSAVIARQARHMTGIIDDLLDVSRVTRGLIVLSKDEVDLRRVMTDAVEQVRPLIESRRHEFSMDLPPDDALVTGDFKRLVQVLANLLNNAAKYTPEGGRLRLRMEAGPADITLSVTDNGIGMAQELLPHVFDLFSQGERTADRAQGGLGLGLALVKSLVELHGGTVSATSRGRNAGSTFSVRLPRRQGLPDPAAARAGEGLRRPLAQQDAAAPLRVMIVDDNVDAAQTLSTLLETATGHTLFTAHSPFQALERAQDERFDVFLLDVGLPGIDGHELARRLRTLPGASAALLVAITGYAHQQHEPGEATLPFDHYFVKPVDIDKLLAVLAARAGSRPEQPPRLSGTDPRPEP